MVEITMYESSLQFIGFKMEGHAGYAPIGQDIVCAAVSVLAQGTIIGLTDVLALDTEYETSGGYITCMVKSINHREREDADVLLRTMYMTLKNLEQQYENHIKVFTKEVNNAIIELKTK